MWTTSLWNCDSSSFYLLRWFLIRDCERELESSFLSAIFCYFSVFFTVICVFLSYFSKLKFYYSCISIFLFLSCISNPIFSIISLTPFISYSILDTLKFFSSISLISCSKFFPSSIYFCIFFIYARIMEKVFSNWFPYNIFEEILFLFDEFRTKDRN